MGPGGGFRVYGSWCCGTFACLSLVKLSREVANRVHTVDHQEEEVAEDARVIP